MRKINKHQLKFDEYDENGFFAKTILPSLEKDGHWQGFMGKEVYHNLPGISSTKLRDFMRDPYTVQFFKEHPELRDDDKPCFVAGRMFHEIILERGKFISDGEKCDALIAAGAKSPRSKKEYKDFKQNYKDRGYHVVKPDEYVMLQHWKKSAEEDPMLYEIYRHGRTEFEKSYFTIEEKTGLIIKFTADIINEALSVIFDAKFVSGRENWTGEVASYAYHIQAAFYLYCARIIFPGDDYRAFPFVHYMKKPPYKISFKAILDEDLDIALDAVPEALEGMAKCYEKGTWGSILDSKIEYNRPLKEWENTLIKEKYDA